MTANTYCTGCLYYRKNKRAWCDHPDREECNDRSLWTGKCQSCRHILKGISDEPCRSCDNHNSGWEART